MKQIFITSIIIAFMAMSQSAFSGRIILGNCPGFDPDQGCMHLAPDGTAEIKILVNPYLLNIQNTDWYVKVAETSGKWSTFNYRADFLHAGGGVFVATYDMPIHPNYYSYNFILHLYDENGYLRKSWQPPYSGGGGFGFDICQGNNRLSGDLSVENFDKYTVYPNPIEKDFTVAYQALQNEEVTLQIFDLKGKEIYTEQFKHQDNGFYSKQINNLNLLKGMYICRIKTGKTERTMKITKL